MFQSKKNKAYQPIDDDYADEPLRTSTCTSRLLDNTRNVFFGGTSSEQQPLMVDATHSYHDSPTRQSAPPEHYENFTMQGPPTMASSSQLGARRWDHIVNLDEFFLNVYEYHQNGGFKCILVQKVFSLIQFIFIMSFTTFFTQCIDYQFLFANTNNTTHGTVNVGKRHFSDAIVESCPSHLSIWVIFTILAAIVYWITRVIKQTQYLLNMKEVQQFYIEELKIGDDQLLNLTWHAIVTRICEAQKKVRLSIHNDTITSLHIYQRILRHRNFMIAMVNQRVLHPIFDVPFIGKIAYLPNNLKHEIERIFFSSSTAPWSGPHLKDEYKSTEMTDFLTKKLKDDCKFYGYVSLVLMPLMLPFQIMESFFSLTDLIKRNKDGLGKRRYSNYGRYMVRHFNELDHELAARLKRSYKYATQYMNQFFSPIVEIVAKNVAFVAAAIVGILAILSAWDEDVLQIEHVLTVMTVCTFVIIACSGMIPDENLVWQPEILMTRVTSEIHYLPIEWSGKAHTAQVQHEFDQLFQMKWMFFLLEITSPIFTPFVLLFWLRPKCGEFIEFFRKYTEHLEGMGDVCTFSLMDVAKHGDPEWNNLGEELDTTNKDGKEPVKPEDRALGGKTELSIMHFKALNPEWRGPKYSEMFLKKFRTKIGQDASMITPLGLANNEKNLLLGSIQVLIPDYGIGLDPHPFLGQGVHRIDGPLENVVGRLPGEYASGNNGLLTSLHREQPRAAESLNNSLRANGLPGDLAANELRISMTYMRSTVEAGRIGHGRHYNGLSMNPLTMQSVFAMPGMTQKEDSIIDIETGPTTSTVHHTQNAPNYPLSSTGLSDMNVGEAFERSESFPRSRLVIHREEDEEEEEDNEEGDDYAPPMSFRS